MQISSNAELVRVECDFPKCPAYREYFQIGGGIKFAEVSQYENESEGSWGAAFAGPGEVKEGSDEGWWALCPRHKVHATQVELIRTMLELHNG
jgi:hypothetical protein